MADKFKKRLQDLANKGIQAEQDKAKSEKVRINENKRMAEMFNSMKAELIIPVFREAVEALKESYDAKIEADNDPNVVAAPVILSLHPRQGLKTPAMDGVEPKLTIYFSVGQNTVSRSKYCNRLPADIYIVTRRVWFGIVTSGSDVFC